ncbi:hypothetical protein B0H17DRAFT_1081174 [Mycena rosella]|uniref:Uncharacterized protein n=1 Tax=Mycena rosella TaxID=1033263 RepID=A0AAD7GAB6_MYCRO|nr:hypothetical protein B0H17DRAFT_1081174 [Mycena rosella]
MAYFSKDAEPFEESQGNRAQPPPDALKAFYQDMERSDLERKLTKRRSSSLWSRKSLRRSSTSQAPPPASAPGPAPGPAPSLKSPSTSSLARRSSRTVDDHAGERSDTVPPMPPMLSRSIIPDTLKELPSWYSDNSHHSVRFNMHNPVGPRWYKNHHLVPPANSRPATRPPSVFSPSFPAMASTGGLDRLEESSRMPALSRSTSNSPLPTPTPNSSQTRMEDAATFPDAVDLLDGSDPHGAAWHHESPYDVGLSSSPASLEESPHGAASPRSRASSATTAQNRRKTVTPSPLSQSTSAVHLHVPDAGHQLPRKLSKRRTVGIFGRHTTSAPASPVDEPDSRGPSPAQFLTMPRGPPSAFPPSSFVTAPTTKQERRGSILGRIAKRFSITRKPPVIPMQVVRQPSPVKRQPSPEKQPTPDPIKRVPPPLAHQESSFVTIPRPASPKVEADRSSSISLEADVAYTMVESTPVQRERALSPEEDTDRAGGHERGATDQSSSSSPPGSLQQTQSPESLVSPSRSPEPIVVSISAPSQHSFERVVQPQPTPRTTSPPPAPEKPAESSANGHRSRGSSSGHRASAERSSSPPNGMHVPSNAGRAQSPLAGNPLLEKPQPPPPSPKLPAVPFPAEYGPTPAPPPRELLHEVPHMTADISPLSTSSMLVNPPTPYTPDSLMPDEPESMPPPVPSKRTSRDPSPSQVSVTGRETETFRLIRSASGTVYASTETIRAAGEQWEVVESSKSKGKPKSQDRESESRREQRRQARLDKEADPEQQKMRSERSRKRRSAEAGTSTSPSQSFPRSEGTDRHHRSPIPDTLVSRQEEPRVNRHKRDEERDSRRSERKNLDPKNKPQPAPPPPAPSRPLERNPSKSARPISEVPTAADMNGMRAREAWDMDRLWKARSMSGMEVNGLATAAAAAPVPPVPSKSTEEPAALYGSSHTAFMVPTPFQQQQQPSASQIYHSMPPAPPSVVYPAGYSPAHSYASTNRASAGSDLGSSPLPLRAPNPLPEPPRESPYEPAPLNLPEYWSKHAGITTAH